MSDLYKHPEQYDREHFGEDEDIGFYQSLCRRLAPKKILELGCGTGRITLPLAEIGFEVVRLDNQPEMLRKAEERRLRSQPKVRTRPGIHRRRYANVAWVFRFRSRFDPKLLDKPSTQP